MDSYLIFVIAMMLTMFILGGCVGLAIIWPGRRAESRPSPPTVDERRRAKYKLN